MRSARSPKKFIGGVTGANRDSGIRRYCSIKSEKLPATDC